MDTFKEYEVIFRCLLVDEQTILKRDKLRTEDCQMKERCIILLNEFVDYHYSDNYIIDTSNLTIDKTVDKIMKRIIRVLSREDETIVCVN